MVNGRMHLGIGDSAMTIQSEQVPATKGARIARWATGVIMIALVVAALGLTLARYDIIGKLTGFSAFMAGALVALLGLLLGLIALWRGRQVPLSARKGLLGAIAIAAFYVGFLATRPMAAGDAPALHDLTTNLADPPQFEVLALRKDNLVGVGTVENWRKIHAQAYGRLQAVTIAQPVAVVAAKAERLAREAGWAIAKSDPARGHLEATASVSYIRFQDDVVVRIRPDASGLKSTVDMRSVSRVGVGDLGINARRIDDFLTALAKD
jgi:uncharacterized protein (DUF1499 family)